MEERRLLDRQLSRLRAFENEVDVVWQSLYVVGEPRPIGHQDPCARKFHERHHGGKPLLEREPGNFVAFTEEEGLTEYQQPVDLLAGDRGEGSVDVVRTLYVDGLSVTPTLRAAGSSSAR